MGQARSSAERRALFKAVQERTSTHPCRLLLDMEDRWSSTYIMLTCAESQRQVGSSSISKSNLNCSLLYAVDKFICELRLEETNNKKRRKFAALALDDGEWTRVCLFCNILQVRSEVISYLS